MRTLLLDVPDAHCRRCRAAILGAFRPLSGVLTTEVDLRRRLAVVTYDEAAVTAAAIHDALATAGYPPAAKHAEPHRTEREEPR